MAQFFNFRVESAEGYWESVGFMRKWWRIYADDVRWAPPAWTSLRQALASKRFAHLQRCRPRLIALEALPRRRSQGSGEPLSTIGGGVLMEQPVAAAVVLLDPRRNDGAAHLALLHVANNRESLERLLHAVQEQLAHEGVRRLILPVGLSPYLGTGVLQDHFHRVPPMYAPYAPPYAPELFTTVCRPLGRSLLFHFEPGTSTPAAPPTPGPAKIQPLDPNRLSADLLPLFSRTVPSWADFPPLDDLEAQFLLRWILRLPALAWVAEIEGQPVGYLLMQPDGSEPLRRSRGGRSLLGRLQLRILELRRLHSVRVLFMGVEPDYRRRGIGRQLWQRMMAAGPVNGWQSVTVGPLPSTAGDGINFLSALGLASRETYLLHRYDFA